MSETEPTNRRKFRRIDDAIIVIGIILLVGTCLGVGISAVTNDDLGVIAFIVGLIIAFFVVMISLVCVLYWKGKRRLFALFFAIIFPVTVYLSFISGDTFSPDSRSQAYGELIAQRLDEYRADHGKYPDTLDQLLPDYLDDLREPKSVWGWLYLASDDDFSLGYVTYVDGWAGYSIAIYAARTREWEYLMSDGPFDLPPTSMPPYY